MPTIASVMLMMTTPVDTDLGILTDHDIRLPTIGCQRRGCTGG